MVWKNPAFPTFQILKERSIAEYEASKLPLESKSTAKTLLVCPSKTFHFEDVLTS